MRTLCKTAYLLALTWATTMKRLAHIGDTQWGSTLTSATDPDLCAQVDEIESAESYYSNHEVLYNGPGPDSNSFANWLLQSGAVSQYFSQPPGTPGWNTRLHGNQAV
jgi:hypothetical protein